MMFVASKTGYLLLNGLRGLTLLSFLLGIGAAGSSMVMNMVNKQFFFFDMLRNLLLICACGFLALTEIPLFTTYTKNCWPLISEEASLFTLGVAQTIIGSLLLSTINEGPNSRGALGEFFWSFLLSGGVMNIVAGAFNMPSKWLFYDPEFKLNARAMRRKRTTPGSELESDPEKAYGSSSIRVVSKPASFSELAPSRAPSSSNINPPAFAAQPRGRSPVISNPTLIRGGSPLAREPSLTRTASISNPTPVAASNRAKFLGFM